MIILFAFIAGSAVLTIGITLGVAITQSAFDKAIERLRNES